MVDAPKLKYKLVVVGGCSGKTSIIERFVNNQFPESTALERYEEQGHKCMICNDLFDFSDMEADHIKPWSKGGKTVKENCQMLCRKCNRKKSAK